MRGESLSYFNIDQSQPCLCPLATGGGVWGDRASRGGGGGGGGGLG